MVSGFRFCPPFAKGGRGRFSRAPRHRKRQSAHLHDHSTVALKNADAGLAWNRPRWLGPEAVKWEPGQPQVGLVQSAPFGGSRTL